MAITDTATDTHTETLTAPSADAATGLALPAPAGLVGIIGTGDHKTLGRLWIAVSGVFGVGSLAVFAWYLLEAAKDASGQTDRAPLNFSLAVIGLILGFAVPMLLGLATVVVPLQVGAATIAFPRAAAAALWTWLLSSIVFAVTYLPSMGGGVGGTAVDGSVLTYASLAGVVGSLMLGVVCVLTTIVTLRPPGMGLDRVPLFSWSMLAAGGLWLLTLPVVAVNAAFISVDLKYGTPALFGARDLQWTQLSWIMLAPQIFTLAIPVLGIAGDAVATFAKQRIPQRGVLLTAIGAFAAFSFGVYVQPAFDKMAFRQWAYIAQVVLLILPLLAVLGGVATALRKGVSNVAGPLVLGLSALVLLLLGAIAAIPFVIGPLGLQSTDAALLKLVPSFRATTAGPPIYTWGVFAFVITAVATGAIAGLFHWAAKTTGRPLPDALAKLLALVLLAGGVIFSVPFLVLGFADRYDAIREAPATFSVTALLGALIVLAAVAVATALTIVNRLAVVGRGSTTDPDPWGTGSSLEWLTDSPPAPGNFAEVPEIMSPEPLLDANDGGAR